MVCQNRLRLLRRRNPGVPIYGLYGGPRSATRSGSRPRSGRLLDDFWAFPDDRDERYKWRNGDVMLSRVVHRTRETTWHGTRSSWPSGTWSWSRPCDASCPHGGGGHAHLRRAARPRGRSRGGSGRGARPGASTKRSWRHVARRSGPVDGPHVLSVHRAGRAPRVHGAYAGIDEPELGFLEYKIPIYAQAFGIPLVPDTCFRPWWPEEPGTSRATRDRDPGPRLAHTGPPARDAVRVEAPRRPPHLPPVPRHLPARRWRRWASRAPPREARPVVPDVHRRWPPRWRRPRCRATAAPRRGAGSARPSSGSRLAPRVQRDDPLGEARRVVRLDEVLATAIR